MSYFHKLLALKSENTEHKFRIGIVSCNWMAAIYFSYNLFAWLFNPDVSPSHLSRMYVYPLKEDF